MQQSDPFWASPVDHLAKVRPDVPTFYACPAVLQSVAREFIDGFDGLVTYAVKANADPLVLANLSAAGVTAFDVASPYEIDLVRANCPHAALHYHNPVRSRSEIAAGVAAGVASWSVDCDVELSKLLDILPEHSEIAVRFKMSVSGAAYDFGEKFGAPADMAVHLLRRVAAAGHRASMTFHPGTQCADPVAWVSYILGAADIAQRAGVHIHRLNVGGGFPAWRNGQRPALGAIFEAIKTTAKAAFPYRVDLVCEPGRAMVAEAFSLAVRVKSRRAGALYLNDGTYGALAELPVVRGFDRVHVVAPDGTPKTGATTTFAAFGPTCDSLDRLSDRLTLPCSTAEEDYLIFDGFGAYSVVTATRFNGYGASDAVLVQNL